MYACPHCYHRSIGLITKLLSNNARPIVCAQCSQRSAVSYRVLYIQISVALIYLAIFPNILHGSQLQVTDILVIGIIFSLKLFAPLKSIGA